MNQCVPSWDLEDNHIAPAPSSLSVRSSQYYNSAAAHDVPMLDYEVAELTWVNGQLSMHGLGLPRVSSKPQLYSASPTPTTWPEKPQTTGGTLESIVNQATQKFHTDPTYCADNLVVPLINHHHHHHHNRSISSTTVPSNTITTVDALVPGAATGVVSHNSDQQTVLLGPPPQSKTNGRGSTCVNIGCSTRVGSCSGTTPTYDLSAGEEVGPRNRKGERGVARVPVLKRYGGELSNNKQQQSVSVSVGSGTIGGWDSRHVTLDTCEKELGGGGGVGVTTTATTSFGSPGNTSSAAPCNNSNAGADDHDSVCHSRPQRDGVDEEQKRKSSVTTKRTRDVHNQSERKRRNKINQRMEALQKLVPNSNKTDKASMLDEVIEYLKNLQTHIHMMSRMSFPSMMMPLAMQQQLQMSMMAMAPMGMSMGMGMDLNSMARQNIAGIPPAIMNPQAFMPLPTWDGVSHDRFTAQPGIVPTDPLSTFLACHPQPITMDAYSKMAALYNQQLQQRAGAGSSS